MFARAVHIKKDILTIKKLQLEKWYFKFGLVPEYHIHSGFMFHFGIFKLISFPEQGYRVQKKNYKGFWLRKSFIFEGFDICF